MKAKNGILKGELKVKGGKLIKCRIELYEGRIKSVKITGDFFMYPEDAIEKLEDILRGVKFQKEEISKKIREVLKEVELVGVSSHDFITAILNSKLL